MEQRIESLEVRLQEEREEAEAREEQLREEIARLDVVLSGLSRSLEELGSTARRTTADVGVTVESLNEEIRAVRGRIDELRFEIDRTREQQSSFEDELDRRFAEFEGDEAVAEVEARQAASRAERPEDPEPFLEMARDKVEQGELGLARNLILDFQRKWPTHERADEAQFLVAETYFQQDDYRSAIMEFNKVREDHEDSRFMARTLLRLGESFAALELRNEAERFFEAVIRAYPDDEAADEARERKRELGSG